jgi:hypothetical protein
MRTHGLEMKEVLIDNSFEFCRLPCLPQFFVSSDMFFPSTQKALHMKDLDPILLLRDLDAFNLARAGRRLTSDRVMLKGFYERLRSNHLRPHFQRPVARCCSLFVARKKETVKDPKIRATRNEQQATNSSARAQGMFIDSLP